MGPEALARKWAKTKIKERYGHMCWAVTTHQGPYGQKGVPDLLFCIHGLFVAIEMKSATGKTTRIQEVELNKIRKAGGIEFVMHGRDNQVLDHVFKTIDARVALYQ